MNVDGRHYRTIWFQSEGLIQIIDQRLLPHEFRIENLYTVEEVATAILDMHVRGAGLIGAAAGYGMYLAALQAPDGNPGEFLRQAGARLAETRPTAVNLQWAVNRQLQSLAGITAKTRLVTQALETATEIADEDAAFCRRIGDHGMPLIAEISRRKDGRPVNILTHCNAGWLAFVDYGSATAPIYAAYDSGIPLHVWVDETRPRNQGASLTAWELGRHGVPHTVIPDNTGGHLMQHGQVDLVMVGSDRTTRTGYVANKIGTYLKALAARDNNIPFYAALPSSTFDWEMRDGLREIPVEQRNADEVRYMHGLLNGKIEKVLLTPEASPAANYAFDVTPPRLVTGLITERGITPATEEDILNLYPEKRHAG